MATLPRPRRNTPLRFASCNLYNLNLPGRALYGRPGWTEAQYAAKIAWLAQALRGVEAEVWGFQELWHPEPLQAAFRAAGLDGDYQLLIRPGLNGQGIACAAAVHRSLAIDPVAEPALAPVWIERFPPQLQLRSGGGEDPQSPAIAVTIKGFSRPVLRLALRVAPGLPLVEVHVAHLKSKGPTEVGGEAWFRADPSAFAPHREALGSAISTVRRTAEAAALRVLLTERMKAEGRPTVVMGDLNDDRLSNTQALITGQPDLLLRADRKGGSATGLYATELMEGQRSLRDVSYTYIHQGEHGSLDHILVSQAFYDRSRQRLWRFEGLRIYNDHLNLEDHAATGTPDHGIVQACFAYDPA